MGPCFASAALYFERLARSCGKQLFVPGWRGYEHTSCPGSATPRALDANKRDGTHDAPCARPTAQAQGHALRGGVWPAPLDQRLPRVQLLERHDPGKPLPPQAPVVRCAARGPRRGAEPGAGAAAPVSAVPSSAAAAAVQSRGRGRARPHGPSSNLSSLSGVQRVHGHAASDHGVSLAGVGAPRRAACCDARTAVSVLAPAPCLRAASPLVHVSSALHPFDHRPLDQAPSAALPRLAFDPPPAAPHSDSTGLLAVSLRGNLRLEGPIPVSLARLRHLMVFDVSRPFRPQPAGGLRVRAGPAGKGVRQLSRGGWGQGL